MSLHPTQTAGNSLSDESSSPHAVVVSDQAMIEQRADEATEAIEVNELSDPTGPNLLRREELSRREEQSIRGSGGRLWIVVARLVGIATVILANAVAGRYLSKDDFGELSVVLNLCMFGSILAGAGLNRTLVRLVAERLAARDRPGAHSVLRVGQLLLLFSLAACTALFMVSLIAWGQHFTDRPVSLALAVSAGAMVFACGWHAVVGELLRALHAVRLAALFGAPPQTVGPAVGIVACSAILVLAVAGQLTMVNFLWANAIAAIVVAPLVMWGLQRAESHTLASYPLQASSPSVSFSARQLYVLCIPILVVQFVQFLATQVDIWVAGWSCPLDEVAMYAAAKRIVSVITLPLQFSQLTAIASIAHLYARGEMADLQRILRGSALLAFIPSAIITVAVLIAPQVFLIMLYGEKYASAGAVLQILTLGNFVNVVTGMSALTLMMTGFEKVLLPLHVLCTAFLIGVGHWAAHRYGVLGLAVTVSISMGSMYVAAWLLTKRYVGVWVHPTFSPAAARQVLAKLRPRPAVGAASSNVSSDSITQ